MTVTQLIHLGDKIDIRLIQQAKQLEKNDEPVKLYKSQVLDIKENGNLEISMPSEGGRLILLPLGIRFEFVFYSMGGLYRGMGQIKERYKKDNVYMLQVELKSQIEKFQRREFYRYECVLDFRYYTISAEDAKLETTEEIFSKIRDDDFYGKELHGKIVDISGGGIRFRTEQETAPGDNMLMEIQLNNEIVDKQYYIVGNVISCIRVENIKDKWFEVRAKFLIKDDKVREQIIRYIFEEERKTRQKDKR